MLEDNIMIMMSMRQNVAATKSPAIFDRWAFFFFIELLELNNIVLVYFLLFEVLQDHLVFL